MAVCLNCINYIPHNKYCSRDRLQIESIKECYDCQDYKNKYTVKNKKEETIMIREEAVIYLLKNPKDKVRVLKDRYGNKCSGNAYIHINSEGYICYGKSQHSFRLYVENDKAEFEVIRGLKEMSFGEAYYVYHNIEDVTFKNFKSVITELGFNRDDSDISKEEYMGLWTIEGVYEDED